MKNLILSVFLLSILSFYSCSTNTAPEESSAYMFLNVGDTREYYLPDNEIYMMFKITGTTKRSDNQAVYIGKWNSNAGLDSSEMTSYYFIKDGYFRSTELDTVNSTETSDSNPFFEQKLAKIQPVAGDTWQVFEGNSDSAFTVSTSYIGRMQTPASSFGNVFGFEFNNIMKVYYAKDVGHIGTHSFEPNSSAILANYIKVNNKEYGKFVPIDNLPKRSHKIDGDPLIELFGKIHR